MVQADGQDLSFVTVEAVDAEGRFQPNADQEVQFAISGPGLIAAVANADGRDTDPYQGTRRKLYQGRALVVVRSSKQSGAIRLAVTAPGLSSSAIAIEAKAPATRAELR
jgi:beta-galactosidase